MAEQADALDSGSSRGSSVQVQLLLPAPKHSNPNLLPIGETFGFVVFLKDVKQPLFVAVQSLLLCTATSSFQLIFVHKGDFEMKNTKTRIIFFSVALTYNLLSGFYLREFLVLSSILQVFYLLSALPTLFLTVKINTVYQQTKNSLEVYIQTPA